jgi:hypothetical protein
LDDKNGEVTHRELTYRFVALEKLMDERDKRYTERFRLMDTAVKLAHEDMLWKVAVAVSGIIGLAGLILALRR